MKPYNPLNVEVFTAPWAENAEDEFFFKSTLELVGRLIGDDVKLGTLYAVLVLSTPGMNLSQTARVSTNQKMSFEFVCIIVLFQNFPSIKRVQKQLTLLIYRYLTNKLKDSGKASDITITLLR